MKKCKHCGSRLILDSYSTLIDNTGGDVCGYDGGNEPHETDIDKGYYLLTNAPKGSLIWNGKRIVRRNVRKAAILVRA